MRLSNLSREGIPVAQQEWLRRKKLLRLSLDHQRQIKQVTRGDMVATVIHLLSCPQRPAMDG